MALSQVYSAVGGDTITAARWNNEFGNIYTNGTDVAFPLTKAVSLAGYSVSLDAAAASTIVSNSSSGLLFSPGSKSGAPGGNGSLLNIAAATFTDTDTAASGTAALWAGTAIRQPTLAAQNVSVTTTDAATLYVEDGPAAGTNQTLTNSYAIYSVGRIGSTAPYVSIKGSDIASASSIAVTVPFADVTGVTNISAISTQHPAGTAFRLRFTGAGLSIVYNATSMITQWGVDYRTVANEILEFTSLGSGNYQCYSVNGPPERTGTTIEANASSLDGYSVEDGSALSRTVFSGLFSVIGTSYGVGDGSTTFNVPDSRGRVAINADASASIVTAASLNGANANTLGGKGGLETHQLTADENGPHTHVEKTGTGGAGTGINSGSSGSPSDSSLSTASSGNGDAHNNMPPWIVKYKLIRL